MTIAELIPIALRASVFAIVFALGLRVDRSDLTWVFRHPLALGRAFLAMFVVMPLVAAALAGPVALRPEVSVALIALALSPIPPVLPNKELKAGGGTRQAVGLLVAPTLIAILLIPVGVRLIAGWFGVDATVPLGPIVGMVGVTILVPLVAGFVVHAVAPGVASRIADPINKIGGIVLLLALLPILIVSAPAVMATFGDGTAIGLVIFVTVGLLVGHFLAGGRAADQTVLALSTATRHPGVALVIASTAFPDAPPVGPVILLYLVLGALVSGVYLSLRRKSSAASAAEAEVHAPSAHG